MKKYVRLNLYAFEYRNMYIHVCICTYVEEEEMLFIGIQMEDQVWSPAQLSLLKDTLRECLFSWYAFLCSYVHICSPHINLYIYKDIYISHVYSIVHTCIHVYTSIHICGPGGEGLCLHVCTFVWSVFWHVCTFVYDVSVCVKCVCVCVCVCVYVCLYIYICMYIHAHINLRIHMYLHWRSLLIFLLVSFQ